MCLIHVQRLRELTTQWRDEDLIYFVFDDEVGEPPTLSSLDAISIVERE